MNSVGFGDFLSFTRHGMVEDRFDHFDPEPLTLVEMGVVRAQTATNQFNLSSFFQGIPGNDGLPGNPGLPGYIVSKIREKRRRGDFYLQISELWLIHS